MIEDAAEAHGARYRGRRVGALARTGVLLVLREQDVTTGEGGMVVTNDDGLAARIRVLKIGDGSGQALLPRRGRINFRMTNVQAALGCAQLERVETFLRKRADVRLVPGGAPHVDG